MTVETLGYLSKKIESISPSKIALVCISPFELSAAYRYGAIRPNQSKRWIINPNFSGMLDAIQVCTKETKDYEENPVLAIAVVSEKHMNEFETQYLGDTPIDTDRVVRVFNPEGLSTSQTRSELLHLIQDNFGLIQTTIKRFEALQQPRLM